MRKTMSSKKTAQCEIRINSNHTISSSIRIDADSSTAMLDFLAFAIQAAASAGMHVPEELALAAQQHSRENK
jgi:hypothetical protein